MERSGEGARGERGNERGAPREAKRNLGRGAGVAGAHRTRRDTHATKTDRETERARSDCAPRVFERIKFMVGISRQRTPERSEGSTQKC